METSDLHARSMSAREIDDHLLAPPALADAVRAVLSGRAVEIVDDLHGGEACTIVTARGERARDAIAVALPEWRAAGPWAVPAGATVFDRVPDIGLVGATTLATASVDLLRLAGADPVAL